MQRHSASRKEISINNWKAALILFIVVLIVINLFLFLHKTPKSEVNVLPQTNTSSITISEFKIIKQEGIRSTNTIRGVIKNINGTTSDVTINARLYYAKKVVAEKSITLHNIKLYEERSFEINFDKNITWSAFDLKII